MLHLRKFFLTSLVFGLAQSSVLASENWGLCHAPSFYFSEPDLDNKSATEVEADRLSRTDKKMMLFSGDVILKQDDQVIRADNIRYNEQTEQLEANGSVVFQKPDFRLMGETLRLNQSTDTGTLTNTGFEMSDRHGRGEASRIDILDKTRSRFNEFNYTTCDPDDRDWYFTGDELEIDDESGLGTARHTTIYFQDIPVFYFPYFQFPIDDRRISGVLTPTFNFSNADNSHLAVPVYWNIAPNFDTTFTPAWYPQRGLLYNSEHRYLFEHNRGQIDYLRLEDDIEKETRWFKKWRHTSTYSSGSLTGKLLLQEVSDDDFFSDFDRLTPGSDEIDHLDRHYKLSHAGQNWLTTLLWQNYQTVDDAISIASRPYQRLPRLTFKSLFKRQENGLQFNIENELVHFKRESSINGNRAHLTPTLSWNSSDSWYFFQPQLQYALTDYSLENNSLGDNSIQRSLPIASLDSGLIFERITGPDDGWLQTLEPRLYFVHIPFEDQSDIPDFDTSLRSDSYSNFFRANRFLGSDRIGDTEQVTFGLGTRIYSNDGGNQLLYARIAQIFYAEDRLVSLNGVTEEEDKSNIIAQISINPNPYLTISSELVYDQSLGEYPERELSINWAKDGLAFNAESYFDDGTLVQEQLSIVIPLNERWSVMAKYHHSLLFDKPVENLLGLSYESCCWGLKILASQVSDDDFEETDQALFFELTLKGLTRAGQNMDNRLRRAIPGYKSRF